MQSRQEVPQDFCCREVHSNSNVQECEKYLSSLAPLLNCSMLLSKVSRGNEPCFPQPIFTPFSSPSNSLLSPGTFWDHLLNKLLALEYLPQHLLWKANLKQKKQKKTIAQAVGSWKLSQRLRAVRKNPPLQAMEGGKVQYRNMKIWQIREWE
jgi:hypothetical protein